MPVQFLSPLPGRGVWDTRRLHATGGINIDGCHQPVSAHPLLDNPHCVALPDELVHHIVQYCCPPLGPRHTRVAGIEWLRQLATVAKSWGVASQRILFSSCSLGYDWRHLPLDSQKKHIGRLHFLESRPDLAKYVVGVHVFETSLPVEEIVPRLPLILPNVRSIDFDMEETNLNMDALSDLCARFSSLRSLILVNPIEIGPAFRGFSGSLTMFGVSGTCKTVSSILCALASSSSAQSLLTVEISYSDLDAEHFALCQHALSRLTNIRALHVVMDCYPESLKTVESLGVLEHLSILRVHILSQPDHTISVLRGLFASAVMPALRTIEIQITSRRTIGLMFSKNWGEFMPFGPDHTSMQPPILPQVIADTLNELHIGFEDGAEIYHVAEFLDLFGVHGRPGVLKVVGELLKLH